MDLRDPVRSKVKAIDDISLPYLFFFTLLYEFHETVLAGGRVVLVFPVTQVPKT
jgi:hypothetical protein